MAGTNAMLLDDCCVSENRLLLGVDLMGMHGRLLSILLLSNGVLHFEMVPCKMLRLLMCPWVV